MYDYIEKNNLIKNSAAQEKEKRLGKAWGKGTHLIIRPLDKSCHFC